MSGGTLRPFLSLLCAAWLWLVGAGVSLSQENLFQITRVGAGESVNLPVETQGRADFDQAVYLVGHPDGSVLTAPQDDAVIVAHQGSVVHLSNVILQQSGASRFGIYVNGGRVELENCEIVGGFETNIYVAAGSVSLKDCHIEGGAYGIAAQAGTTVEIVELTVEGNSDSGLFVNGGSLSADGLEIERVGANPLYVAGPGRVDLANTHVDSDNQSRVVLLNGLNISVNGLILTGAGGDGLIVQNGGDVAIRNVATDPDLASAIIVQNAASLDLSDFAVSAFEQPIQISGVSGGLQIAGGQVKTGADAYGISIYQNAQVQIEDVAIIGGQIGVFAQGPLNELSLIDNRISGQTTYGVLLQDMGATPVPTWVEGNRITAGGEALSLAALDGGFVGLHDNILVAEGATAVYLQDSALSENSGNLIIAAPESADKSVLFYADVEQTQRQFLPDGPVSPIEGWFDDNEGNTVLSHVRILQDSDEDELRRAIADMLSGEGADNIAVLDRIALEATLSEAALEDRGDVVRVELAPPSENWLWSEEAIAVVLEPIGGDTEVYYPDEFPIELPTDQYRLLVDGEYQRILNLTGDLILSVDQPAGPYAVWRDEEGQVWRGPSLQLRKPNALATLAAGLRPLEIGEYYGHKTVKLRRAGVGNDEAAAAVAKAQENLPDLIKRMEAERDAENWPEYNRLWTIQRMYFELIGALGGVDDLEWIHAVFADQDLPFSSMDAAVQIEQRVGLMPDGPNWTFARNRLRADPSNYQARQMVTHLARAGDARALQTLARRYVRDASTAGPLELSSIGVAEAFDLPPTLGVPIYRNYLTKLRDISLAALNGAEVDWSDLYNTEVWRNATRAILYLGLHGDKADRSLFNLPIPVSADFYPLSAIMAHPGDAVEVYFGSHAPIPEFRMNTWQTRYGEMICPALALSTDTRRETLLLTMKWAMREAVIREYYPDYWQLDRRTRQNAETSLTMIDEMSRAHCGMTETVIDLAMGENGAGEYDRKLRQSDLNPQWWVRPSWATERAAALGRNEPYASVEGLSPYPTATLIETMHAAGSMHDDMAEAFALWHGLLSDAYQTPQGFFPFGSERRLFRLRNEGGDGSLSIGGIVDVRMLPDDGKLTVAVSNNIFTPDYGGLAAMITAPDREPFEQNNHRNMIGSVRLERDGQGTEGTYVQTLDGGVHLFEIPFDGDMSDTYLRIGMQFLEDQWPLDFALFDSQLSYELNLQATGGGAQ